jgi:hypothetical protein
MAEHLKMNHSGRDYPPEIPDYGGHGLTHGPPGEIREDPEE